MDIFQLAEIQNQRAASGKLYREFLRVPSLSVGLYELPAEGADPQQPHTEDEVYFVVSGRGRIQVGEHDQAVGPGSIIFVPAHAPHRFHSIAEGLSVLVFFAPAEYSARS